MASRAHKLKFEGAGERVMGRCSCGDVYLASYALRKRPAIREEHARHLEGVERRARFDAREVSTRKGEGE